MGYNPIHFNNDKDDINENNDNNYSFPFVKSNIDIDINNEFPFKYVQSYCICFIDIVNSTPNVEKIENVEDVRLYYSTFLNTSSYIIKQFQGKTIKNMGDSLLYYFPKTMDRDDEYAFRSVLDCNLEIIDNHNNINKKLPKGLQIDYRISADYGEVELSLISPTHLELSGNIIDKCRIINHLAKSNEMVVGNSLYQTIRKFDLSGYLFKQVDSQNADAVYQVNGKNNLLSSKEKNNTDGISKGRNQSQGIQNRGEKITILLIDDDKDILFSFQYMLKSEGYIVESFSNPKQALEHFLQDPYHYRLVILDIRMPDINGIHLYYKFKAVNPQLYILFVTALDILEELSSILNNKDLKNILRKPINNEQFIDKVKLLLSKNL